MDSFDKATDLTPVLSIDFACRPAPRSELRGPGAQSGPWRRIPELLVECREDDVETDQVLPGDGGCQLQGIVSAQTVFPGQGVGTGHQGFGDGNPGDIRPFSRESALCPPAARIVHHAAADRARQRRPHFCATDERRGDDLGFG